MSFVNPHIDKDIWKIMVEKCATSSSSCSDAFRCVKKDWLLRLDIATYHINCDWLTKTEAKPWPSEGEAKQMYLIFFAGGSGQEGSTEGYDFVWKWDTWGLCSTERKKEEEVRTSEIVCLSVFLSTYCTRAFLWVFFFFFFFPFTKKQHTNPPLNFAKSLMSS